MSVKTPCFWRFLEVEGEYLGMSTEELVAEII
jgi:hypothetical protein